MSCQANKWKTVTRGQSSGRPSGIGPANSKLAFKHDLQKTPYCTFPTANSLLSMHFVVDSVAWTWHVQSYNMYSVHVQ